MKLWSTITENKCFVKMLWHLLGECVKATVLLVCSICTVQFFFFWICAFFFLYIKRVNRKSYSNFVTVVMVCLTFWPFFFFGLSFVPFFSFYIYYYTDTTNFTIFSQLLRYQFLISQNKIIKYETVINHN